MSWASVVRRNTDTPPSVASTNALPAPAATSPPLPPPAAAADTKESTTSNDNKRSPKNKGSNKRTSPASAHSTPPIAAPSSGAGGGAVPAFKLTPAQPPQNSLRPAPLMVTPTAEQHHHHHHHLTHSDVNATAFLPSQQQQQQQQQQRGADRRSPEHASSKKLTYSPYQLRAILQHVASSPPDVNTMQALADNAPAIVDEGCFETLRREQRRREQFPFECAVCSAFDLDIRNAGSGVGGKLVLASAAPAPAPAGACPMMTELIKNALKAARQQGLTFLMQSPDVVFAQIRLAAATDPHDAKLSKRMKTLPPKCVDRIRAFLCGPGFHLPCPSTKDHATWTKFSAALRFDSIMQNETPLFAELGKFWRKTHNAFQKFCHLLFWRDEAPLPSTSANIISHHQMPVVVACTAGDIDAAVWLMHLRFYVLPDEVLFSFPFMQNLEPIKQNVLRHLCRYFYRKQSENVLMAKMRK